MRSVFILAAVVFMTSCSSYQAIPKNEVNHVIDQWHLAAANADYNQYFDLMTNDAVFIGTDATENWQLAEFKNFAKPYFDEGKAWSFQSLERNIYQSNGTVYFDELLDTQMGICRGSGVIKMEDGKPRIAHYVLSIAVPNDHVSSLTNLKKEWDERYTRTLKSKG